LIEFAPPRQLKRYVSMTRSRTIIAFLVAPLMTPIVIMAYDLSRHVLIDAPFYFLTYGVFAYLATIIFGIPALLFFRWLRWTNVILFVAGGAFIGLLVSMFVMESYTVEYFLQRIGERTLCMVAGGLSALMFRVILLGRARNGYRVSAQGET
jgi:hypothetical protein